MRKPLYLDQFVFQVLESVFGMKNLKTSILTVSLFIQPNKMDISFGMSLVLATVTQIVPAGMIGKRMTIMYPKRKRNLRKKLMPRVTTILLDHHKILLLHQLLYPSIKRNSNGLQSVALQKILESSDSICVVIIPLRRLRSGATTDSVLREFATRFTGALRDWFDSHILICKQ